MTNAEFWANRAGTIVNITTNQHGESISLLEQWEGVMRAADDNGITITGNPSPSVFATHPDGTFKAFLPTNTFIPWSEIFMMAEQEAT